MYKVTKYPHGTFSWADSASTDANKAKSFYQGLFGWGKNEVPISNDETYTMFEQDGVTVAALNSMDKDMQAQGVPSHWNSYVTVDDVDAMVDKVKKHGGTVIAEPFDVFDSGRMMVIQDPTGAMVSLWQAQNHIGAGMVNAPGAMLWNELATRDAAKAREFYGNLLGWTFQQDGDRDYWMIVNNGRMNGGIMQMDDSFGEMPPTWVVYFNIADLDKALADIPKLGGKIIMGRTAAGDVGDFSIVADPAGAVFNVMQANEPQPWDE